MSPPSRPDLEKRFWNRIARRYDRFIMRNLQPTYSLMLERLERDLQQEDILLEVGAGTGLLSFAICGKVQRITAVDIAEEMVQVAREKQAGSGCANILFKVADSYQLPFACGVFDVVLISNVLHLLAEPETALREARRVLRPGGRLIAPTFCHGEGWKSRMISFLMSLAGFRARRRWSLQGFKEFFQEQGLEILHFEVIKGEIPLGYIVGRTA